MRKKISVIGIFFLLTCKISGESPGFFRGTAFFTKDKNIVSDAPYVTLILSTGNHFFYIVTDDAGDFYNVLSPGRYTLECVFDQYNNILQLAQDQNVTINISQNELTEFYVNLIGRKTRTENNCTENNFGIIVSTFKSSDNLPLDDLMYHATLKLKENDRTLYVTARKDGKILSKLSVGRYTIEHVRYHLGVKLEINAEKLPFFEIESGKKTRVMVTLKKTREQIQAQYK